jgi:hypothetical protein
MPRAIAKSMLAHFEIVPAFTNSRTDICVGTAVALLAFFGFAFSCRQRSHRAESSISRLLNNKVRNSRVVDGRRLSLSGVPDFRQVSTGQDGQQARCHTTSKRMPQRQVNRLGRERIGAAAALGRLHGPEPSPHVVPSVEQPGRSSTGSLLYIRTEPKPGFCVMFSAGQYGEPA